MDLYCVLQKANLSTYYDAFLSNGGDDIRQLLEATDEELQEILRVVGMTEKPLHAIRFKKALNEWKVNPNKFSNGNSLNISLSDGSNPGSSNMFGSNDSLRNYMNASAFQPANITITGVGQVAQSQARGIPVSLLPNATLTEDERIHIQSAAEDLVKFIPEYPLKDSTPARKNEAGLFEVIKMSADHNARTAAVYRYSAIYGRFNKPRRTGKPMTHHEVAVNEAAAQLCLRMPSLLSRREDLYPLAREVVKIAEDSWKITYRQRSQKKRRNNPQACAVAAEFTSLHQTNPQAGYIGVQEKMEIIKSQLCDMISQQDKLRMAFRDARNSPTGPSMAEIQKEIDNLCSIQQLKIAELGRLVLEFRKFQQELTQGNGNGDGTITLSLANQMNASSLIFTSNANSGFNNGNVVSLAPVSSVAAANLFATAGSLTVFPGLAPIKQENQNTSSFLINNGANNDINRNNSGPSMVTLAPGVMALSVAPNNSGLGGNNVASYMTNDGQAQFSNFSLFTLGQMKAVSAVNNGNNAAQVMSSGADIIKLDSNVITSTGNVYQTNQYMRNTS